MIGYGFNENRLLRKQSEGLSGEFKLAGYDGYTFYSQTQAAVSQIGHHNISISSVHRSSLP